MHELIGNDWLDEDYIARHVEGCEALRERALPWPPERAAAVCGIAADDVRELARDYGTTRPAAIRLNYGMQRVARRRQRGAADRAAAVPDRRLAPSRRRPAAVGIGLVQVGARRRGVAAARPAGRPQAAHDQHEHDRRRPAARGVARLRPEDRGAGRLQQQPGGGGAAVGPGGAGLRARRPVHRGARALHDRHRRPRRHRAAGHHAARAPGRAHLATATPTRCSTSRRSRRSARRSRTRRSFASWRSAWASPSRASPTTTRRWRAPRCPASTSTRCARDGWVKLPLPEAPFADGDFPTPSGKVLIDAPGLGVPDYVPPLRGRTRRRWRRATRWR